MCAKEQREEELVKGKVKRKREGQIKGICAGKLNENESESESRRKMERVQGDVREWKGKEENMCRKKRERGGTS